MPYNVDAFSDAVKLLERHRRGDPLAFSALFARLATEIRRWAAANLKGPLRTNALDDVVQDYFLRLHRWPPSCLTGGDLRRWSRRALTSAIGDECRRKRPLCQPNDALDVVAAPVDNGWDDDLVKWLLARLTPIDRKVVYLRYWQGLSCADVAKELNATENAIWARCDRIRKKLRRAG